MFVRDGWTSRNFRAERSIAVGQYGFITEDNLGTAGEIESEPFYRYIKQQGMGRHCGMTVQVPTGDVLIFNFERLLIDGPAPIEEIARLNSIKGHLARSALFASRLGLERARNSVEALGIVGLPAALLSARGSYLASNHQFDCLRSGVFVEGFAGRTRLKSRQADVHLQSALGRLGMYGGMSEIGEIMSLPVQATPSTAAMIVHLIPIRRAARDVFASAACALVVTTLDASAPTSAQVLRGLFDLTNAEAEIARGIAAGKSIHDIARANHKAPSTVRQQLKSVFEKTGVKRQAELTRLLAGTGFPEALSKVPTE